MYLFDFTSTSILFSWDCEHIIAWFNEIGLKMLYLLRVTTMGQKWRAMSLNLHILFSSDSSIPFSRWDRERIVAWLNEIGLNMYLSECRRWVKNGEQLLKASGHEIEKVALFSFCRLQS